MQEKQVERRKEKKNQLQNKREREKKISEVSFYIEFFYFIEKLKLKNYNRYASKTVQDQKTSLTRKKGGKEGKITTIGH